MTFLGYHPDFARHHMPGHPENQQRAQAILDRAKASPALRGLERLEPDRPATDEELLKVHARRLLVALRPGPDDAPHWLDPDTYVTKASDRAARLAARLSALAALRCLERDESGFVVARPPGHHATRDRSMGFCLLNNAALAARAALDSGMAQRVLIFDHDVHHGNGTQDIFWEEPRVVYESFHLGGGHYPGTGGVDELGAGAGEGHVVNAPLETGDGDAEVRSLLDHVFLPVASAFRPDLVILSAGFDSLEGDPLGGLRLSPTFYGELVTRLRTVCSRVVALLEGGYQVDRIPLAVEAELRAMAGERLTAGTALRSPACEPLLRRHLGAYWDDLR